MKAAVLYGKEDIRVENVPDLVLDDYLNVLVKVKAAGICGTDIHFYEWLYPDRVPRFAVLGHEFAGEVVAVGEGVTNVKVGDRVAVEPLNGCGTCAYCRSGDYHLCKDLRQSGKHYSGGFAEYTKVNCNKCVKIPENVSYRQAALLDCYAVGVHSLKRIPVSVSDVVVVYGAGPMGLCTAQIVKAAGARKVILIDVVQEVLDIARTAGIEYVVNSLHEDPVARVMELTDGARADIVFDSVGGRAPTMDLQIQMLRPHGKLGMIGVRQDTTFNMAKPHFKEIDIVFIFSYAMWNYRTEFSMAMNLLEKGAILASPLVTHTFPLASIHEAFETAKNKSLSHAIKVMIISE